MSLTTNASAELYAARQVGIGDEERAECDGVGLARGERRPRGSVSETASGDEDAVALLS